MIGPIGTTTLGKPGRATTADSAPSAASPPTAAAKRQDDKLKQARDALATLTTLARGDDVSASRKAAAADRLARAKERLRVLRMMMTGGDPKVLARMAAQIAKEISAAAKDYAAAGGSPADLGGAAAAAPMTSAPADAAQTAPSGDPAASADAEAPTAAAEGGQAPDGKPIEDKDGQPGKAPDAAPDRPASRDPGDADFIREAKRLAKEVKAVIEAALRRLRRDDPEARDLRAAGDAAGADVDQAERDLGAQAGGAAMALAATPPASLISISA